jgi:hypothetical protein
VSSRFAVASLLFALLAIGGLGADERPQPGAVEQRGGPVSQDAKPPPLELTNAQRELVRQALLLKHNEVEFQLAETKSAKDFEPKVGENLPQGLVPDGFPDSVIQQLPQLRDYAYLKMKNRVLIIDATTRKIVDVFSETEGLTRLKNKEGSYIC